MCRLGLIGLFVISSLWVAPEAFAQAYNFYEHAGRSGCASIVFPDRRRTCEDGQRKKNDACRRDMECDFRKAEKALELHKETKRKLDSANEADKPALRRKLDEIEDDLEAMREKGEDGIPLAQKCVDARAAMKTIFAETIPLVERAGAQAIAARKILLDRLEDAKAAQAEAKRAKDAAERGNDAPRRAWEAATREVRDAERALEDFNRAHGPDIKRYVDRLVDHYKQGRVEHEKPERDDQNRLENCKKLSGIRW